MIAFLAGLVFGAFAVGAIAVTLFATWLHEALSRK